ncbi:hypothetical protein LX36DRAFT_724846, partial [Colletotrichum falcatum]
NQRSKQARINKIQKHTTPGIRRSSPTRLLLRPSLAYLWESGRDPEFSSGYGRMWYIVMLKMTIKVWWMFGPNRGLRFDDILPVSRWQSNKEGGRNAFISASQLKRDKFKISIIEAPL